MGIAERLDSLMNYEIKIDLERQVDRKKALLIIGVLLVVMAVTGYIVGDRWFWTKNESYYEYQVNSLKEALRKQPGSNQIRIDLAMADYLNGDVDKAIGILRNVLTEEPRNAQATLNLGLILSEQKEYQDSIGLLTRYTKQHQGLEIRIAYLYLGRNYLASGKPELALKYLQDAVARDPANPVVYYYLGQTYEKQKNMQNAIANYEKALQISPEYSDAENALITLLKRK